MQHQQSLITKLSVWSLLLIAGWTLTACQPIQPVQASQAVNCDDSGAGKMAVMRSFYTALNAGNQTDAMAWLADNAVVMVVDASTASAQGTTTPVLDTFSESDELAAYVERTIVDNLNITPDEIAVSNALVTATIYTNYYEDVLEWPKRAGVVAMTVRNCQIVAYAVMLAGDEVAAPQQINQAAVADARARVATFVDQVFNHNNLAVVDQLVDPDVVLHHPLNGEMLGQAGVKQWGAGTWTLFPEFGLTYEIAAIAPNVFVVTWHAEGMHGETGNEATFDGHAIYRLEQGKIVEIWQHFNTLALLQQIGAVPVSQ